MVRTLLSAAAFLLFFASSTNAATLNLLLTTDYYWPTVGGPSIGLQYEFIENPTNGWLSGSAPQTVLWRTNMVMLPGVTEFNIALDAENLDDIYLRAWGFYTINDTLSFYVAEPPEGPVQDATVFAFGAPWIPLADLGDGLSGNFRYVSGISRGPIGTWELTAVQDAMTPVPEPTSIFLLGSGLAAVVARRYRRREPDLD